jgi:hypothetical protein
MDYTITAPNMRWNPIKKWKQQPRAARTTNSVEALANALQHEGRVEDLERELDKIEKSKLSEAELESWWHLYGIAAFRAGREQEATARFEEAHRRFPSSAHIRFSLGQQYVNARQIERGFELFRSCLFPQVPREFVLAQVRYAYLWNRYEDGRVLLRPILDAYKELRILDDTFLYIRGLPFFGTWWSYLAALSILGNDTIELEAVTEYVTQNCCDYDFEYLKAELVAYRDDKPEEILPFVEQRLTGADGSFASGYSRMQCAIIKGRVASSQKQAEDQLDSIVLSDNDFSWLGDIRALAKAEIAHRFEQLDVETQRIAEFLDRQPMLFEPDIAISFHLLRYQERLKPRYQTK